MELNKKVRAEFGDNYRTFCRMNGFDWEIKMYDEIVQGRPVQDMIKECEEKVASEQASLDRGYSKRDRYGEYYPDNEAYRWGRQRRDRYQKVLDALKDGSFHPPYVIHLGEDDSWDITSIEKWSDFHTPQYRIV